MTSSPSMLSHRRLHHERFDSLNTALAHDTHAYTQTLSQVIAYLDPSQKPEVRFTNIDAHDLVPKSSEHSAQNSSARDNSKFPFTAPVRSGRRCEFVARARDHARSKSMKRKQSRAERVQARVTAGFESVGTVPEWVEENEKGVRQGRYLDGLEERQEKARMAVVRQRMTDGQGSQKQAEEARNEPKGTGKEKADEISIQPDVDNEEGVGEQTLLMKDDTPHWPLPDDRSAATGRIHDEPALHFDPNPTLVEATRSALRRAKSAPGSQYKRRGLIVPESVDELRSMSSHDWEGSILEGYGSTSTTRSNSQRGPLPPTLANIKRQERLLPAEVVSRKVSSAGLSALSTAEFGRLPDRTSFDTPRNGTSFETIPETSATASSISHQHSSYRYHALGRSNTIATSVDTDSQNIFQADSYRKPYPSTIKRQSVIDAEKWEDRKVQNFAKRVGWKQALPRVLEDGKIKVKQLRRRSQPWRAQPAETRPRVSREIVASAISLGTNDLQEQVVLKSTSTVRLSS